MRTVEVILAVLLLGGCEGIPKPKPEMNDSIFGAWDCHGFETYDPVAGRCVPPPPEKLPEHAVGSLHNWKCEDGFHEFNGRCYPIFVPDNAIARGDQWECVAGYEQCSSTCIPTGGLCDSSSKHDVSVGIHRTPWGDTHVNLDRK